MSEQNPHRLEIPPQIVADLAGYKRPGWLKRKYLWWKELWECMGDKYVIERHVIKKIASTQLVPFSPVMEIERTDYYNLRDKKFYKSPKNALSFGYFSGAFFCWALRRGNNNPQYEFWLISLGDLGFIRHVTGADENEVDKKDCR